MRRALLLLALPLVLLGPGLLPGKRFLPLLPVAFEPLASEHPAAAEQAWRSPNLLAVDALFPILSDRVAIREMVLAGHAPLWQPLQGSGAPLLGGTIVGPLYPPNALALLVSPDVAAGWLALVALFLAGAGMWLFLARTGLAPAACAAGALALQAGGFALANLHYGMKVDAALWLPWQLWALEGLLARRRFAGPALLATCALPFLAGFPGIAVMSTATAIAYLAARAAALRQGAFALRAAAWMTLGVGAAAIQWLPTAAASGESLRAPMEAREVEAQALPLASTLGLVVPHLFGRPDTQPFADQDAVTWWLTSTRERERVRAANALEWNLFAGGGVLALAIAGLLAAPRRARFPALALLVALGFTQAWPGVRWLYHLPPLALGSPARAAAVAWVLWAWLAALGVQALAEHGRARAFAGAVALALLAGALLLAPHRPGPRARDLHATLAERHGVPVEQVRELLPEAAAVAAVRRLRAGCWQLAAVAVAVGLISVGARRARRPHWMALLITVEGAWTGLPHLSPRALSDPGLIPPSESMAALAQAAGDGRVLRIDTSASGIDDVVRLARPQLPELYGIADLTPYVAFPPRRTVELLTAIDPAARFRAGASRLSDPGLLHHPVLDLLRVRAVLAREPLHHPRLELVHGREGWHVYRRSGALPQALVVPGQVTTASDATALGLLAGGAADPREVVVLAPGVRPAPRSRPDEPFRQGDLAVTRPSPSRLDVELRGTSGGWLVLTEAWAPGWRASVDGRQVPLVRADHGLRAVHVPPGDSLVRTWYAPRSVWLGAAVSAAAAAVALVAVVRASIAPAERAP